MDHEVRSASRGRRPRSAPAPEMDDGGSDGRRRMERDGGGYAARGGHFAAAGQRVPALRLRSVGRGMAKESGARASNCCPLRGRSGDGVPAQSRCGAVPGRVPGTAGKVWVGASPGEDAAVGVRSICGREQAQAWREEAGDVHIPRIRSSVWNQSEGPVHGLATDGEQANGGKAEADKADAARPDARAAGPDRSLVAERSAGLLSILRSARKSSSDECLPVSSAATVAKNASTSWPAVENRMAAH